MQRTEITNKCTEGTQENLTFSRPELADDERATIELLAAAENLDQRLEVQDMLQESGDIKVIKDGNLLVTDSHVIEFTVPAHFDRVKNSLLGHDRGEDAPVTQFVDCYQNADNESIILVSKLPAAVSGLDLEFGRNIEATISDEALAKHCDAMMELAEGGEFDTRAFDPSNWAYSENAEKVVLLSAMSRTFGEPEEFVPEIEKFRSDYGLRDRMPVPSSQESVNVVSNNPETSKLSNFSSDVPFQIGNKRFASVEGFVHYIKIPSTGPEARELKEFKHDLPRANGKEAWKIGRKINEVLRPKLEDMYEKLEAGVSPESLPRGERVEVNFEKNTCRYGSDEHHALIETAIRAKFDADPEAQKQLLATGDRPLIHEPGGSDNQYTSLPNEKFAEILTKIRDELKHPEDLSSVSF